jgi:hypothetical protein
MAVLRNGGGVQKIGVLKLKDDNGDGIFNDVKQ